MWDCYFLRNIFALIFIVASAGAMAIALYWQELKPVRNRCQEVWTYSKKYPVSAFTNTLLGILIFVFVVLFYGWLYPFIVILYDAIELQIGGVTIGTPAFRNVSLSVAGSITLSIAVLGVILTVIRNILTRQQNRTDEQRLVTEQISRGVEQIGAYKQGVDEKSYEPNIEVRLGGLYSLQRIMQDSTRDMLPIARILYAYVRENVKRDRVKKEEEKEFLLPEDIDSALNIIIQFKKEWKKQFGFFPTDSQLHLSRTDFTEYSLKGIDFSYTDLRYVDFSGADLFGTDFSGAKLFYAKFSSAELIDINFSNADLSGVNLVDMSIVFSDLSNAKLFHADLSRSNFLSTDLSGASLYGANLSGASLLHAKNLTQQQINSAIGDVSTTLPEGLKHPEVWLESAEDE